MFKSFQAAQLRFGIDFGAKKEWRSTGAQRSLLLTRVNKDWHGDHGAESECEKGRFAKVHWAQ
jgi:hypothetical protein